MKWQKKLQNSLKDEHDVATEFFLAWIAVMLTSLVVLGILGMLAHASP